MDYRNLGNATSATAIGGTAIESTSPVRDGIGSTEERLSEIHNTIDMLEKRLDTLLTPCAPTPAATATQSTPQQMMSHLQGRVRILNEGFQHAIQRLHDLNRRIEL